jgi:hypothetical protein
MPLQEDPHFEEVVNEIKEVEAKTDSLIFRSVLLRLPKNFTASDAPVVTENVPDLDETLQTVDQLIGRTGAIEDRLNGLLTDNTSYGDQVQEYLRDIEESEKSLRLLKKQLKPEMLREGEAGKTDVSWLSTQRNVFGGKLHTEANKVQEIVDEHSSETDPDKLGELVKRLEGIISTATMLNESAQYLSWFTRKVVETNESLSEYQRDFTVGLVSQWIQEEIHKISEHFENCLNLKQEIEAKLQVVSA